MFDALSETMKRDEQAMTTPKQRWLKYAAVAVTSVILFGGLYMGIRFLE